MKTIEYKDKNKNIKYIELTIGYSDLGIKKAILKIKNLKIEIGKNENGNHDISIASLNYYYESNQKDLKDAISDFKNDLFEYFIDLLRNNLVKKTLKARGFKKMEALLSPKITDSDIERISNDHFVELMNVSNLPNQNNYK